MVSPPELIDDAAAEIFVRLPPDEPAHLIRASLVCRQWRRIITDGAFLRRYRASHGVPPLLGFVCNLAARVDTITSPRFFPTAGPSIVPMPAFLGSSKALDCGHGRVLLGPFDDDTMARLVVLDPITGDHQRLPDIKIPRGYYTAAVFCAARGCAHLNCRGGPYRVVVAGAASSAGGAMRAHLYSSEAAAWVASARLIPCPHVRRKPAAVVGDDVYFQLMFADDMILRYDMGRNRLSTFHPPADAKEGGIVLLSMADGSLGLAGVRGSRLCLWSTDASPEGIAGWVRCKSIELMEKIPFMPYSEARVVGCAEGLGVVFVETEVGLFTIDLKSGRERKVSEPGNHFVVFPITSFYTPDCTSGKLPSPRTRTIH